MECTVGLYGKPDYYWVTGQSSPIRVAVNNLPSRGRFIKSHDSHLACIVYTMVISYYLLLITCY